MKVKMMLFSILLLVLSCQMGESSNTQPQKVHRIVYESHSNEWYKLQADLWKQEIEKNRQNAEAWHNYYNAVRYAHFEDIDTEKKKNQLADIIEQMSKAIPDTYEYYFLSYWNKHDITDLTLVKKAHELRPDEPEPYYPFVDYNELQGNKQETKKWLESIYLSRDISPSLLNYNYNVLMSVGPRGILFTNGDNDTYPAWILQQVHSVRPDVLVLNISMSTINGYLAMKLKDHHIDIDVSDLKKMSVVKGEFSKKQYIDLLRGRLTEKYPDIPLYYALTVYDPMLEHIREHLFIVGLAQRFSKKRIDNTAIVKKNMENYLRLDYLRYDWYREKMLGHRMLDRLNMNYVVPMIMLGEHYAGSGEKQRANEWYNFALDLAKKADNSDAVEKIQSKMAGTAN